MEDSTTPRSESRKRTKAKRMRLPNGFGQISEIKGRRLRKPFRAMVTVGKTEEGRPIVKTLKPEGYFRTYNEAYAALVEYNKSPYDLEPSITIAEFYAKWTKEVEISKNVASAWNFCSNVKGLRLKEIRARHIKEVIENGEYSDSTGKIHKTTPWIKTQIKTLFTQMLNYALQFEMVDRNYAKDVLINKEDMRVATSTQNEHIIFTDEEIEILWANIDMPYVRLVLIQIYTGFRPQELGLVERANCDFETWTLVGGIKTEAGIMRPVPVHEKIKELVKAERELSTKAGSKYLFICYDTKDKTNIDLTYSKYSDRFQKIIRKLKLNPNHRAHDPRKTFVTLAKKYNVDEYAIKRIVGHKIKDVTENVYTEREVKWLHEEISKIK